MTKERATRSEEDTSDKVQLQQLINETPVMLTRCSRDLRYVFVSRAYANMLGRSPQDIEGKPIVEIMGEEGFSTIRPYVNRVLSGQHVEYETAVSFEDIGKRLLRVVYTPDRDGNDIVNQHDAGAADLVRLTGEYVSDKIGSDFRKH